MAQSINTKADLVIDATSFLGMGDYGKIMIGDHGFEFFDNVMLKTSFKFLGKKLIQ
ncbi:Uncharacterized protein conserved in bacteria [Pediococcus pentosaceus]|nr:Uncharacterized protein conserved in bacteria [Pediococcus pentosaceus]